MMEHLARAGESKLVERCSWPQTGIGCVSRVYTDLAVIDTTPTGVAVVDMCDGLDPTLLQALTAEPLCACAA
jgi:3-oxoadipate CoA-transferase beta subunit